jgi:hypothetical protein
MADEQVTRRRVLKGAGIAGTMGLAAAVPVAVMAPGVAAAGGEGGGDAILGAWRGPTNLTGVPKFDILITFAAGGGLVSSGSIDLQPDFLSTPAYGAWKRTGPGVYGLNFFFFAFDPKGNPSGTGQVTSKHLSLDDGVLEGTVDLTIFDPNDVPVFTTTGTVRWTRIEL